MNSLKKTGILLLILLSIVFSNQLNAQYKPFQFGFKGAVNLGWMKTDTKGFENDGAQIGGSWGFLADIVLVENYAFTTGFDVLYINSKYRYPDSFPYGGQIYDGNMQRRVKSRYLQIPISFTMKTNDIKEKFRIYGQIGYGLGFLLNAKAEDEFFPDAEMQSVELETENIYDELTFTRSALILGLGVEIPIYKSTYVRTGFEFNNCFIDMVKSDDVHLRNNFFEFSAAVIF